MKLPIFVGSLLASCGILCIASQPPYPQTQTEPVSTIAGKVLLRGAPVSGVVISVQPAPPGTDRVSLTRTDDSGQFRITNIRPGRYTLRAKAPGLVAEKHQFGRDVSLAPGEVLENIVFSLVRGGVIAGRVTDEDGGPVVEQLISITDSSGYGSSPQLDNYHMLSTDDRGAYRIFGLPSGRYKVSVGDGGWSRSRKLDYGQSYYPHTFHPNVRDESKAGIIEVTEGGEVSGVDIVVGRRIRTYEVAGRIMNAQTGQPQPGIKWGYDGNAVSNFGRLSDERGGFRITGLMPGRYSVFAGCEGDFYSGKFEFEVTDHDITGLEIRRNPGAGMRGKVVVEGSNDPAVLSKLSQVSLTARSSNGIVNSRLEPDGTFYFCGLQPGRQKIEANTGSNSGFWLTRVERKGVTLGDVVEVSAGEHLTDVLVVLASGTGVIRGQVSFEGYELPPGVRLQILARRVGEENVSRPLFAVTDDRGRFAIEGLAPGEYILSRSGFVSSVPNFISPSLQPIEQRVNVTYGAESIVNLVLKAKK
jgi:hypothetical protein